MNTNPTASTPTDRTDETCGLARAVFHSTLHREIKRERDGPAATDSTATSTKPKPRARVVSVERRRKLVSAVVNNQESTLTLAQVTAALNLELASQIQPGESLSDELVLCDLRKLAESGVIVRHGKDGGRVRGLTPSQSWGRKLPTSPCPCPDNVGDRALLAQIPSTPNPPDSWSLRTNWQSEPQTATSAVAPAAAAQAPRPPKRSRDDLYSHDNVDNNEANAANSIKRGKREDGQAVEPTGSDTEQQVKPEPAPESTSQPRMPKTREGWSSCKSHAARCCISQLTQNLDGCAEAVMMFQATHALFESCNGEMRKMLQQRLSILHLSAKVFEAKDVEAKADKIIKDKLALFQELEAEACRIQKMYNCAGFPGKVDLDKHSPKLRYDTTLFFFFQKIVLHGGLFGVNCS